MVRTRSILIWRSQVSRKWWKRGNLTKIFLLTTAIENYLNAVTNGIVKIMSKMGISTIQSYRGAQVFEAIGIANDVINQYFTGTTSSLGGINLDVIAEEVIITTQNCLCTRGKAAYNPGVTFNTAKTVNFMSLVHLWFMP